MVQEATATRPIETTNETTNAPVHLVRADINMHEFRRWAGLNQLPDPGHAMHVLLKATMGDRAPKPFRVMARRQEETGVLYGYSGFDAKEIQEYVTLYSDPVEAGVFRMGNICTKLMPTNLPAGHRLGFEVLVRPVMRRKMDPRGENRRDSELDVYVERVIGLPKESLPVTRQEVYAEWLAGRMEKFGVAMNIRQTQLTMFRRTRVQRKQGGPFSEGPEAVLRGALTITDPDVFPTLLSHGIGRHRSYGFGMVLLRPPSGRG